VKNAESQQIVANSSKAEAPYPNRRRKALRPHSAVAKFGHCGINDGRLLNYH
jgi:hypothetical protein